MGRLPVTSRVAAGGRMSTPNAAILPEPPRGKTDWPWRADATSGSLREEAKITIVMPSFNQAEFIEQAIRSVLLQGCAGLELLVLDGGSTDGTVELLRRYEPWIAWWRSSPDGGQTDALNEGFARATGDWLGWLNSDDVLLPGALDALIEHSHLHPGCRWISGNTVVVDAKLSPQYVFRPHVATGEWRDPSYGGAGWIDFLCTKRSGTALPQPSTFFTRSAYQDAGPLNPSLHFAMDHEYWARLARLGLTPCVIGKDLALHRLHDRQKTAEGIRPFWQEELALLEDYGREADPAECAVLAEYKVWLQAELDQRLRSAQATTWQRVRTRIFRR